MTDKNYNQNNPKRGNATDGLRSGIITFFSQHKVAADDSYDSFWRLRVNPNEAAINA